MGLKKSNVTINGYTYPELYAVFNGEVTKLGKDYQVGFNLNKDRETALKQAVAVKKVRVKDWDRKTDLIAVAYQQGKEPLKVEYYDENSKLVTKYEDNVFTGWIDDIVIGE